MKKCFLSLLLVSITSIVYGWGGDVVLVNADGLSIFNDKTKTAYVKFVFSEDCTASVSSINACDIPFSQYVNMNGEWQEEWKYATNGFLEYLKKKNKHGMQIIDHINTDYCILFSINSIKDKDYGSWSPVWWEIIDGNVQLLDNTTGTPIVEFKIIEFWRQAQGITSDCYLRKRMRATLVGVAKQLLSTAKM